jgi:hypothetical protein
LDPLLCNREENHPCVQARRRNLSLSQNVSIGMPNCLNVWSYHSWDVKLAIRMVICCMYAWIKGLALPGGWGSICSGVDLVGLT